MAHRDLLVEDEARTLRAIGSAARAERRSAAADVSSLKGPSDVLINVLGGASASGARVNTSTALGVSTVYACTQILSGAIGRLPIKLYQKTAKGREEVTDHPAAELLSKSPDGIRTAMQFKQANEAGACLRGNYYSRIIRDAYFQPIALKYMDQMAVEAWSTPDGNPFYRYRGEVLPAYEVFHHKDMSLDGIVGLSPVTCMRNQIGLAITTQEHGSRFFNNGAAPSMVLVAPLGATKAQMDLIRDEVNRNHVGSANHGKPFIAAGGVAVSSLSLSNQDSQFLESRKFDIEEIARAYRVPLFLLQSTEKSTSWGTGIESISLGFVNYSLSDRLERWEQEADMALLTEADRKAGYYFNFSLRALLAGSHADRAAFYRIMREICAMSVNEIRRAENLNDLPDYIGDNYTLPTNGNAGAPTPAQNQQQQAAA